LKKRLVQFNTLCLKEIRHIIFSPIAVCSVLFFLLGNGIPFFLSGASLTAAESGFRQYISRIPYISAIVISVLTMGLWSDERKKGTEYILLSLPIPDYILVLGKFAAVSALYIFMLLLTLPVLIFAPISSSAGMYISPGCGAVISAYLMIFLYGAASISIGLFFSSLFANSILSFILTVSSLLVLDTIQFLPQTLILSQTATMLTTRLSFAWHLDSALRGILDTRDIFFYVLPCAGILYGTTQIIRNRRV